MGNFVDVVPKRVMAVSWMLAGTLGVMGLVMAMNKPVDKPPAEDARAAVEFRVERPKPPKKVAVRKKEVVRRNTTKTPRAPLPKLSGLMAGMSFGIPDFDATAVDRVSDGLLGDGSDLVMTEDAVDEAPRALTRASVAYPASARAKGVTGYVTLNVLVDAGGSVQRVQVLEANPQGIFEQAAQDAVRQWRFEPATYKGQNVKVWARQTVHFKLI
ncbi:MAG: energy transducer TonB [Deltaproteobacteria bacterium]|nr:energy transducer TonB [Deltaproteobacteria bacterium]